MALKYTWYSIIRGFLEDLNYFNLLTWLPCRIRRL